VIIVERYNIVGDPVCRNGHDNKKSASAIIPSVDRKRSHIKNGRNLLFNNFKIDYFT
jgi:hypothetical protein